MELSGRHLRMEGGPRARRWLYAGRKAAPRDSPRRRPHRAMPCRRRTSRGVLNDIPGTGPDAGANSCCPSEGPHDDRDRLDCCWTVDHAGGGGHDETPFSRARRPMSVRRAERRRRGRGCCGRGSKILLEHGTDLHRGEPHSGLGGAASAVPGRSCSRNRPDQARSWRRSGCRLRARSARGRPCPDAAHTSRTPLRTADA